MPHAPTRRSRPAQRAALRVRTACRWSGTAPTRGRGPTGYGSDSSERDLLDVMADVRQALPVDAERVSSGGSSQGGYIGSGWRCSPRTSS